MKSQYQVDGVLVRPFESTATNFLSSQYYNGREIVDLLATPDSAQRWSTIIAAEIGTISVMEPSADELAALIKLRAELEQLYAHTISASPSAVLELNALLSPLHLVPSVAASTGVPRIEWASPSDSAFTKLSTTLIVSAAETVTGERQNLLRRCHAPRCVLYYTQLNSRQHWCSSVCGNRARVARHASKSNSLATPAAE